MAKKPKIPKAKKLTPNEINAIFPAPGPKVHVVKFVAYHQDIWWWRRKKLFAVPGIVHARIGDKIAFVGIDDKIIDLELPGIDWDPIDPPAKVRGTQPKSIKVVQIKPATVHGVHEYKALGLQYGLAVGGSLPKIIIYD